MHLRSVLGMAVMSPGISHRSCMNKYVVVGIVVKKDWDERRRFIIEIITLMSNSSIFQDDDNGLPLLVLSQPSLKS